MFTFYIMDTIAATASLVLENAGAVVMSFGGLGDYSWGSNGSPQLQPVQQCKFKPPFVRPGHSCKRETYGKEPSFDKEPPLDAPPIDQGQMHRYQNLIYEDDNYFECFVVGIMCLSGALLIRRVFCNNRTKCMNGDCEVV